MEEVHTRYQMFANAPLMFWLTLYFQNKLKRINIQSTSCYLLNAVNYVDIPSIMLYQVPKKHCL